MRHLLFPLSLVAVLLSADRASAATILFDVCDVGSLCGQLQAVTTLNGNAIDVSVTAPAGYGLFGDSGGNRAFGINVNGSGVGISNVSSGFSYAGTGGNLNGYGFYEFLIDGPHTGSGAELPLGFTVTRSGGFTDDVQLFESNPAGYLAAAHLRNNQTGVTGFVAADNVESTTNSPVPEPATMLLLGTGLLAAFRSRRA